MAETNRSNTLVTAGSTLMKTGNKKGPVPAAKQKLINKDMTGYVGQ